MRETGKRLLSAATEIAAFAKGENVRPMTLYMPDGDGGMVERVVSNIQEYRAAWYDEGRRVLMRKDDPS